MLQLGVIGKYPQFDIDPEAITAIESITKHPVVGSSKTRDMYEEFLCEPHPTISVKKFASWFDVPEFHDYVAKLIYEEVETQCKTAEELAKMLANMPKEVQISGGGGGGSGIPLQLPTSITKKNASGGSSSDSGEKKNDSNGNSSGSGKDGEKKKDDTNGNGSGQDKDGKNPTKSTTGADGQDGNSNQSNGNDSNNNSNPANSSQNGKATVSNEPCQDSKSMDDHNTFDDDGNWSLSNSGEEAGEAEELSEIDELRNALDDAIKEIGKAAKSLNPKNAKPKKIVVSFTPSGYGDYFCGSTSSWMYVDDIVLNY
jgi:hypothetical protein